MAKNRKDEHYPVVREGRMQFTGPFVVPQVEVNIEQYLSKVNRRLYRQSRSYTMKIDIDATAGQTYNVYALSDSWMNERALKMAYAMYLENSEDERDRLKGTQVARWEDFRVVSGTNYQKLNPLQFTLPGSGPPSPVELATGEFINTMVVDAAGVNKGFTWGASSSSRYSILEEYDKAGNAQTSPSTSTGDVPYDDLMADDNAVMATALQTFGNSPPYDATGVSADRTWVNVGTLSAGAAQRLTTGFFKAPCGIVLITAGAAGDEIVATGPLSWTVKAGDYKGVHAPSLLE
jgi:hypothetical protein